MSPYNYAVNDPICFFDIFGAEADGGDAASKYLPPTTPTPGPAFQDPNLPGTTSSAPANPDHDIFSGPNYSDKWKFINDRANKASPGPDPTPSFEHDTYNDDIESVYNVPIIGSILESDLKSTEALKKGRYGEALIHRINWVVQIISITQAVHEIGRSSEASSPKTKTNKIANVEKTVNTGKSYEELLLEAQQRYPKKAGKIELHHIIPKCLGGPKIQELVPLDGAYHQMITNAFRNEYPYGYPKPIETHVQEILRTVYGQYPLP